MSALFLLHCLSCARPLLLSLSRLIKIKRFKPRGLRFVKEHFLFPSFINLGKNGNLNKKNSSLKGVKRCTLVPEHLTELVMRDRPNLNAWLMKVFNYNVYRDGL